MAILLDGKVVRDEIRERLKAAVEVAVKEDDRSRKASALAIIQVGNNPESSAYISQKKKFGEAIGVRVEHIVFPAMVAESEIVEKIASLNIDSSIHGIIVQMPLPASLDKDRIVEAVTPAKDVDGLTAANVKKLWENRVEEKGGFVPATAKAVVTLLDYYHIPLEGRHAVVIGRSELVGKPLFLSLVNRNATVTLCHSKTRGLQEVTRTADIVIVAAGKPRFITAEFVRAGQTVVDVGITISEKDMAKNMTGDVDFEAVKEMLGPAGAISPVPGGVGPLTVASLFENVVQASVYAAKI